VRPRRIETKKLHVDLPTEVREQLEHLEGDASALTQMGHDEQDADSQPSFEFIAAVSPASIVTADRPPEPMALRGSSCRDDSSGLPEDSVHNRCM
jgi:hypothetical protein